MLLTHAPHRFTQPQAFLVPQASPAAPKDGLTEEYLPRHTRPGCDGRRSRAFGQRHSTLLGTFYEPFFASFAALPLFPAAGNNRVSRMGVCVGPRRQARAGRQGRTRTTLSRSNNPPPPPPVDLPAHGKEGTDPSSKDREIKRNQGLLSDFARLSVLTYLDFSDMGEGGRMTGKADSRCPLCQRGGGSNSIVPPGYGVVVAVVIAVTMRYN